MNLPVKYSKLDWRKGEKAKVREEYIKILFENTQTVLMIALKEKSLPDLHINQYEYIESFLKRILSFFKDFDEQNSLS